MNKPSRREILKAGGVGSAGLAAAWLLQACDLSTDPSGEGNGGDNEAGKGPEAPMLAQRVDDGELPPVEERLPADPMVLEPLESIGVYGGQWRTSVSGTSDVPWINQTIGYEHLVRWDLEWEDGDTSDPIPNLASSYEVNDEGTEFTFQLREGVRWSDGEPFTADDIMFAVNDVLLNEELSPVPPSWLTANGEPVTVEKLDDYSVRFVFASPNGVFLRNLAGPDGWQLTNKPKHYLEEFHADYNDTIDELVDSAGAADWVELFEQAGGASDLFWQTTEIPSLHAWVLTTALGDANRVVAERNPYYWKTDPEGSQLPYLDEVVFEVTDEPEVMLTQALQGEFDMHMRHFTTPTNKPVLAAERETGNYDFFELNIANMNVMMVSLNLTHPDEVKREVFQNKDFRIGLSHAINRQEIIDSVFQRQGEPWQGAPLPDSPLYDEEMAKQYSDYDVDLANEYLDNAGYTERDGEDFRLGPDGERITISMELRNDFSDGVWVEAFELIRGYWREVGIEARTNVIDRTLYEQRVRETVDFDGAVFIGHGGLDVLSQPLFYFPYGPGSEFAPAWWFWYTDPNDERGEEPPEAPRRQMEIYDQINATPDTDEQIELMREILQIAKEEFYSIGITTYGESQYGIVKNNFHNVPSEMAHSVAFVSPGPANSAQYYKTPENDN